LPRNQICKIIISMIATVAVCVALIKLKKYLKPKIVALDSCLGIIPFTEFSRIMLLMTKIIKKKMKIVTFNPVWNSTPLYVENFTIVESNTMIVVKIKIKISEVLVVTSGTAIFFNLSNEVMK
jgi:hypothetical protein